MELSADQIKKYKGKSISWLLKKATEYFNRFIRQRDDLGGYFKCISCGEFKSLDQMNAGHFLSAGHNGVIRFNEDNVNGQCIKCNLHSHGNPAEYRKNLVKKIGEQKVLILESASRAVHKWDKHGLIYVIETYKAKCN